MHAAARPSVVFEPGTLDHGRGTSRRSEGARSSGRGVARVRWLKAVAVVAAVASLTINYGLIDLIDGFTGYVDQERNQVLDVGWGAVFGVVLPLGLLALLRRPERRIAGVQQTAVVALALALAGALGERWWYLVLAAGVGAIAVVLVALHPARQTFGLRGQQPDRSMLVLAAVAAGPSLVYVWRMASAQRRDLPPTDAVSNGFHHWTVMAALALLVLLLYCSRPCARQAGGSRRSARRSQPAPGRSRACWRPPEQPVAKATPGHGWFSPGLSSPLPPRPGRAHVNDP